MLKIGVLEEIVTRSVSEGRRGLQFRPRLRVGLRYSDSTRKLRPDAALGFVSKRHSGQFDVVSQVLLDERHFDHSTEILGGLFKARQDSTIFFQPTDQSFNDVSLAVFFLVELHGPGVTILVFLRRNDRPDAQIQKIFVDPIGTVSLVAAERNRPGNRFSVSIDELGIGSFQNGIEYGGFVRLARCEMEVQRMPDTVAEKMDFGRKPSAGAA